MDTGISYILSNLFIFIIDSFIFVKTLRNSKKKNSLYVFSCLAFSAAGAELFTIISMLFEHKIIHPDSFLANTVYIILMFFLSFSGFCWYEYLKCSIDPDKKIPKLKQLINFIPVALLTIECILSKWTHHIFYTEVVDGEVRILIGNFYWIQIVCCYCYFIMGIYSVLKWWIKTKCKARNKFVKYFFIFFMASIFGNVLQIFVGNGGFIQIGISLGMIFIYLEMYIDEIKRNDRLHDLEEVNRQLQEMNRQLEESTKEKEEQIQKITLLNKKIQEMNAKLGMQIQKTDFQIQTMAEAIRGGFKISRYDKDFSFTYISEQLAEMLGYTVDELMEASGGSMAGIVDREEAGAEVKKAADYIKRGDMYIMNYKIRCKDGSWKYVEDRGRLIRVEGAEDEFWSFIVDKDELVRTENALKEVEQSREELTLANMKLEDARAQAESASNAKTTFLLNMSHDIRTPMNAILGFAQLLETKKEDPEIVSNYISKIRGAGEYLLTIINNILDMARIESGSAVLDIGFWDFLNKDSTAIAVFEEEFRKRNIKLSVETEIQHRYVALDSVKIKQIWVNLISNAIKYTPEGGTISLSLREIPCNREGYATYITEISDTGVGMSNEFIEHIFEPFSRERNTTQSGIMGTGLGMSIVKKLVDLMDGIIKVESEIGKGTKFTVIMSHPIIVNKDEYLKVNEQVQVDTSIFEGKHILLAEDNELNAEIAVTVLENAGFIVDHANDGVECMSLLQKVDGDYYSLILMDIQMPNLDGYDCTFKIRKLHDEKKANIPIIAMTADAFDEDKKKALEVGMNDHISKPFNVQNLLIKLSEYF